MVIHQANDDDDNDDDDSDGDVNCNDDDDNNYYSDIYDDVNVDNDYDDGDDSGYGGDALSRSIGDAFSWSMGLRLLPYVRPERISEAKQRATPISPGAPFRFLSCPHRSRGVCKSECKRACAALV